MRSIITRARNSRLRNLNPQRLEIQRTQGDAGVSRLSSPKGFIADIMPAVADAAARSTEGALSLVDYLLIGDTWSFFLNRFLKAKSTVLELGCGCGAIARRLTLSPHIDKYIGIDSNRAGIDWCRETIVSRAGERFEFHWMDVFSESHNPRGTAQAKDVVIPAAGGSIDLIFSRSWFGHFSPNALEHFFQEVRRALTPGGVFLPGIRGAGPGGNRSSGKEIVSIVSPADFLSLADKAGFSVGYKLGHVCDEETFYLTKRSITSHVLNGCSTTESREPDSNALTQAGRLQSAAPAVIASDDETSLSEEMVRLNQVAAGVNDVESAVHPQDFIYSFCCKHPLMSLAGGVSYYFEDGALSARKFVDLVNDFDDLNHQPIKVLEFASGYGCVSRHLKKFRHLDVVSSDIHPEAIRFLGSRLGVKTLLSAHVPEEFPRSEKFDVVFALSFFSHMPKSTYGRWLQALYRSLEAPGYLIFTTLGLKACRDNGITPDDIPADGFWFESRSEQHDLDTGEYGMTISTPEFVRSVVQSQTEGAIIAFKHGGWWDTQDLWVLKREK
jgi:SAM-dependent methyltransferase